VADVTLDLVAVVSNRRITRSFREIEAELLDANEKALKRIERALRDAGALDGDGRPKVFQALDLEPAPVAAAPDAAAPTADHLKAMLERQYRAILAHDPGTRLGSDPEELHDMRVATRRLRAFLRAARELLEAEWAESLRTELAWLGGVLGAIRDLDVLTLHLRDEAERLEPREQRAFRRVFDILEREHAEDRRLMLEALRSPRYLELLDRLESAVAAPRLVESDLTVRDIAAAEFRKLRRAVKRLGEPPSDEELHALRIRGKRARYAAELAESAVGRKATRFIDDAKVFQDVLGEHQDAVVAEQRVRAILREAGGKALAFAAGRIVERERQRRATARAALPKAWARLRKRGKAAWT
jgi:CHAD domain-containing protein